MRFTFADEAPASLPRPRARRSRLHQALSVVFIALTGLAGYEIVTFAFDYLRALRG